MNKEMAKLWSEFTKYILKYNLSDQMSEIMKANNNDVRRALITLKAIEDKMLNK